MITLNDKMDTCTIEGVVLKAGQSIDYKSCTEPMISIGRITKFKYAGEYDTVNKSSVWMLIEDMGDSKQTEWVSVNNWYNRFGKQIKQPAKTNKDDKGKKSKDLSRSPI